MNYWNENNLKSFIVYRFQYLTEFNQHKIDDRDKKVAKMNFHLFDRLLSMDNICIPSSNSTAAKKAEWRSTKYGGKFQPEAEVVDYKVVIKKNSDLATSFTCELIAK